MLSTKFEETCDIYDNKINELIINNRDLEERNTVLDNNQSENEKFIDESQIILKQLKEQLETSYKEKEELLTKLNILMDEYKNTLTQLEEYKSKEDKLEKLIEEMDEMKNQCGDVNNLKLYVEKITNTYNGFLGKINKVFEKRIVNVVNYT